MLVLAGINGIVGTDSASTAEEVIEGEPYRAAADYEGVCEEEVSFKMGDEVDVITKEESGEYAVSQ